MVSPLGRVDVDRTVELSQKNNKNDGRKANPDLWESIGSVWFLELLDILCNEVPTQSEPTHVNGQNRSHYKMGPAKNQRL